MRPSLAAPGAVAAQCERWCTRLDGGIRFLHPHPHHHHHLRVVDAAMQIDRAARASHRLIIPIGAMHIRTRTHAPSHPATPAASPPRQRIARSPKYATSEF